MKRIFSIGKGAQVPDGTKVFPLLNCRDSTSGLPTNLLEDFSLAVGEIEPHRRSKIHVMLLVTQVTFVLQGELEAWVKDGDQPTPYSLRLGAEQAILTRPGTFLQLRNHTSVARRVLYMVSPSYVFLMVEGSLRRVGGAGGGLGGVGKKKLETGSPSFPGFNSCGPGPSPKTLPGAVQTGFFLKLPLLLARLGIIHRLNHPRRGIDQRTIEIKNKNPYTHRRGFTFPISPFRETSYARSTLPK